jgi:hypothetical protein
MLGFPEALAAALRNTPAEFLRYVLPGLIGRAAGVERQRASDLPTAPGVPNATPAAAGDGRGASPQG